MRRRFLIFLALVFCALLGCGSLSAQIAISNGASLSNGAKLVPGGVCVISTNTLPPGTSGVLYDQTLQTANCIAPFQYSVFTGVFPPWATFNQSTGRISGIAAPGDYSFVIKLQDGSGNAFFTQALTISTANTAGQPLLPDASLTSWDTTLATGTPASGPDICIGTIVNPAALPHGGCSATFTIAQINSVLTSTAVCGNVIVVQKDALIDQTAGINNGVGIPLLDCPNNNWLIVERDPTDTNFPAEGQRVDPSYAGLPQSAFPGLPYPTANANPNNTVRHMPRILQKATNNTAPLTIPLGSGNGVASHQRWIGFELARDASADIETVGGIDLTYQPSSTGQACEVTLNSLGKVDANSLPVRAVSCMNVQPHDLVFDRFYIHGDAQRQTTRGIQFGGSRRVAFIDSWGSDIQETNSGGGGDAQFYAGGTGHGFTNVGLWKILNNETSSTTEGAIFCGGFTEPLSPATGFDGVPHDLWFGAGNAIIKNPLWDTAINQTLQETTTIDGVNYPPAPDQELVLNPSSVQLAVNQVYPIQELWLNDSFGGFNLMGPATQGIGGGTISVCDSLGNNCVVDGNLSTVGSVTRVAEHNVGSGAWVSANQRTYNYTAPAVTGTFVVKFAASGLDNGRANINNLGNNRTLTASTTITVVAANPVKSIVVSPSAGDLRIQPSYPSGTLGAVDAAGNSRQFCYTMFAIANYTTAALTWKVDGVSLGNANIGSITQPTGVAANEAIYCSADSAHLGNHSITAFDATNGITSTASVISVSATAPILGYDLKPMNIKNAFECKCVEKLLFENNYLENAWGSQGNGGGQQGTPMLFQSVNQASQNNDGNGIAVGYGPGYVNDATMRNNFFRHMGGGFVFVPLNVALGMHRVAITANVCDDCNYLRNGHGFIKINTAAQTGGAGGTKVPGWTSAANPLATDISFTKNTVIGAFTNTFSITNNLSQFTLKNFTFQDNIVASTGTTTFVNANGGLSNCNTGNSETLALVPCFTTYIFNYNELLDSTAPAGNFISSPIFQLGHAAAGFANYNNGMNGDYRLCQGFNNPSVVCSGPSIFAAGQTDQAHDGTDLGAPVATDVQNVTNALSGTRTP
jgi:hypothetical protein